jgi:hypothetical protein
VVGQEWLCLEAVWQKNEGSALKKIHFFLCFFSFSGIFVAQTVEVQAQPPTGPLQKKSCLKTYGRFFRFWEMWQNRRVNVKPVQCETFLAAQVSKPAVSPISKSASGRRIGQPANFRGERLVHPA